MIHLCPVLNSNNYTIANDFKGIKTALHLFKRGTRPLLNLLYYSIVHLKEAVQSFLGCGFHNPLQLTKDSALLFRERVQRIALIAK